MVWGTGEAEDADAGPIVLDDVPDVSEQAPRRARRDVRHGDDVEPSRSRRGGVGDIPRPAAEPRHGAARLAPIRALAPAPTRRSCPHFAMIAAAAAHEQSDRRPRAGARTARSTMDGSRCPRRDAHASPIAGCRCRATLDRSAADAASTPTGQIACRARRPARSPPPRGARRRERRGAAPERSSARAAPARPRPGAAPERPRAARRRAPRGRPLAFGDIRDRRSSRSPTIGARARRAVAARRRRWSTTEPRRRRHRGDDDATPTQETEFDVTTNPAAVAAQPSCRRCRSCGSRSRCVPPANEPQHAGRRLAATRARRRRAAPRSSQDRAGLDRAGDPEAASPTVALIGASMVERRTSARGGWCDRRGRSRAVAPATAMVRDESQPRARDHARAAPAPVRRSRPGRRP